MLWQIGIFAASVAVIIFILYLVPMVKEARQALRETLGALSRLQADLEQTTEESRQLIRLTQHVLKDIQGKMRTANSLFDALEQTGEAAGRFSHSVKLLSGTLTDTVSGARSSLQNKQETVRDIVELTTTGVKLWQKWQAQKTSKTSAVQTDEQS